MQKVNRTERNPEWEKSDKFVDCPATGCKSYNGLEMVYKFFSAGCSDFSENCEFTSFGCKRTQYSNSNWIKYSIHKIFYFDPWFIASDFSFEYSVVALCKWNESL